MPLSCEKYESFKNLLTLFDVESNKDESCDARDMIDHTKLRIKGKFCLPTENSQCV